MGLRFENKQRKSRIAIKNWELSVGTSGSGQNNFCTNTDMAIDVWIAVANISEA